MGCAQSLSMPHDTRLAHLRNTPFLLYLDEQDLRELAHVFCSVDVRAGAELPTSTFYYVVSGSISVQVGDEKLCNKRENDFFSCNVPIVTESERHRKHKDAPRWVTDAMLHFVANSSCTVLYVPPKALTRFMARHERCSMVVRSMMWSSLEGALNQVPFIQAADLDEVTLRKLGELFQYQAVEAGVRVVAQGSITEDFYIIIDGAVEVERDLRRITADQGGVLYDTLEENTRGQFVPVTSLGKGSHFGEMSLILDEPRSAHVYTTQRTLFARISKDDFQKAMKIAPPVAESVLHHCKIVIFQSFRSMGVPIFAVMDDSLIGKAANTARIGKYSPNEVICEQGALGTSFHVIIGGAVNVHCVTKSGGVEMKLLTMTNYFGELSLLVPGSATTATCTAAERGCTLLTMDREGFLSLFDNDPAMRAELSLKVLRGKCTLEHVLDYPPLRELFREHLKLEMADEHLSFYELVNAFDLAPPDDKKARALEIVNEFVKEGSPQQINVPSQMRTSLIERVEHGKDLDDTFKPAAKEVFQLIESDNFPRFKATPEFEKFLSNLGSYDCTDEVVTEILSQSYRDIREEQELSRSNRNRVPPMFVPTI